MKRFLPIAAALLVAACATGEPEPDFYLGGIQVNEPDAAAWVETLEESGFNTVHVTVYARQGEWDSAHLRYDEEATWVVDEIRAARRRGLAVVLVLRVDLDRAAERNEHLWHGMILPRTDAELDEWFRRYGRFVDLWAEVAEAEGVDVLAIGSELNALTNAVAIDELPELEEYWTNPEKVELEKSRVMAHAGGVGAGGGDLGSLIDAKNQAHMAWARQTSASEADDPLAEINRRRARLDAHWRALIASARQRFGGRLSYAANFDQYAFVPFWDALDLISINAYFPLRSRLVPVGDDAALLELLREGWLRHLRAVDAFRRQAGAPDHPILFTEIGYVSRANSTIEPWAASGFSVLPSGDGTRLIVWEEQPRSLDERALAMRALFESNRQVEAASGRPFLVGLLYWKLSSVPSHVDVEPFVLLIGDRAPSDPLLAELLRFVGR